MKKLIVLASVLICVVALHVPLRVEDELEDLKEAVSKRHSNRQKIEEERRKSEEKRRKAEEERRKEEEERLRKEKERQEAERRKQEEKRRKQEEERRKVEEKRVKAEEKRKKHEEERLRKEKERRQRLEKERQKQEKERQKQRQEKLRKEQEKQRERERQQEERRRKEEERRQKEEEKRRNEEEKRKEQWEREYQRLINKHGKDEEFWKLKKDKKEEHYTPKLKKKLEKGEKITAEEDVEFQNEYGPYKSRNTTAVIDLITAINNVNDIESDIVRNAPDFDLRNTHLNTDFCKQKQNKKKAICKNKKYRGNSKRSMITNEEGWERKKRDGMRNRVYLWLDRTVPYEIDSPLEISRETIESSLKRIEELTCVRFVKHTQSDTNWIKFVSKTGCWSSVGREFWSESFQEISLGTNCVYKGIIMHEVLHALGFYHEQSRPDRDQYVEIFWENIQSAQQHNFMKYKLKESDTLGAPYDYSSIMHYGKYSFALDANKPTIQSVRNNLEPLGQRSDLTPTDIFQVNEMYNCANTGTGWSDWSTYGPCDLNCMKSRNRFCMDPKDKTNCPNPTSTTMLRWGIDTERVKCSDAECYAPVNGHWNRWASWSDCSVTCDEGTHTRTRECTDPAPANGGDQCVGERIESRTCISRSCTAGPYDCTFDIDSEPTCSWKQDDTDDFDWIKNSGSTSSSSTGPSGDHTSGTGFYVYMESSSPARPGWKTRLLSPTMSSGDRCMKFAYNMYGFFTGRLPHCMMIKIQAENFAILNKVLTSNGLEPMTRTMSCMNFVDLVKLDENSQPKQLFRLKTTDFRELRWREKVFPAPPPTTVEIEPSPTTVDVPVKSKSMYGLSLCFDELEEKCSENNQEKQQQQKELRSSKTSIGGEEIISSEGKGFHYVGHSSCESLPVTRLIRPNFIRSTSCFSFDRCTLDSSNDLEESTCSDQSSCSNQSVQGPTGSLFAQRSTSSEYCVRELFERFDQVSTYSELFVLKKLNGTGRASSGSEISIGAPSTLYSSFDTVSLLSSDDEFGIPPPGKLRKFETFEDLRELPFHDDSSEEGSLSDINVIPHGNDDTLCELESNNVELANENDDIENEEIISDFGSDDDETIDETDDLTIDLEFDEESFDLKNLFEQPEDTISNTNDDTQEQGRRHTFFRRLRKSICNTFRKLRCY